REGDSDPARCALGWPPLSRDNGGRPPDLPSDPGDPPPPPHRRAARAPLPSNPPPAPLSAARTAPAPAAGLDQASASTRAPLLGPKATGARPSDSAVADSPRPAELVPVVHPTSGAIPTRGTGPGLADPARCLLPILSVFLLLRRR